MRYNDSEKIFIFHQHFFYRRKQHLFVFRPSASGDQDFFPGKNMIGNQLFLACFGASLPYLIVPRFTDRFDMRFGKIEPAECHGIAFGNTQDGSKLFVEKVMKIFYERQKTGRAAPHRGICDKCRYVPCMQFP